MPTSTGFSSVDGVNTLRSAFDRSTRWACEHPFASDVLFAVLVGVLSMIGFLTATRTGSQRGHDVIGGAIIVALTINLMWRRQHPLRTLAATTALVVTFWVMDYPTNFDVFSVLALYAAVAHGGADRRRVWRWAGTSIVIFSAVALLGVIVTAEDLPPSALAGIVSVHLAAAVIGETVNNRRLRLQALKERTRRAQAEHELQTRQAVLNERTRIARDLHDIVAHGVSVMVVQAGAAEAMLPQQPDRAIGALHHIQTTGREAMDQMRQMLNVLRDDHQEGQIRAPQPGLADLDNLVDRTNHAGVATELIVTGSPSHHAPGPDLAGFRIAQEALTNIVKHGGAGARATVMVTYTDDSIRLEITDDGLGTDTETLAAATGHGLVGMRERVELYGGTLTVGPRHGGGFRVAASIPTEPRP